MGVECERWGGYVGGMYDNRSESDRGLEGDSTKHHIPMLGI